AKITAASGCAPTSITANQPGSSCQSSCDVTCATWDYQLITHGYGPYFDVLGTHTYASNNYQEQHANGTAIDIPTLLNDPTVNGGDTLLNLIHLCNADTRTVIDPTLGTLHGCSQKPIWITEMGVKVGIPEWGDDPQTAANALWDFYTYIRGNACNPTNAS